MRSGFLLHLSLAIGLFAVGNLAITTRAAADPAPKPNAAKEGDKAAEPAKEEKDKTGFMGFKRYDLGFYTLVVFGLLVIVLGKFAWKPIMDGLQKREDAITSARTEAEKAREEAAKFLAEIKAQRAKANEEIVAILAEARKDAESFREQEKARVAAGIQEERDRLRREIATAKDQALEEIWEKTVQLATLVSTKAIGRAVAADDHRRLIADSMAELQQRLDQQTKA